MLSECVTAFQSSGENMKKKALIISLLVLALSISMLISLAKCDAPKVAVYFESANIDVNERSKIVDALGTVAARFGNQIGIEPDFDIITTWNSDKNTKNPKDLLDEAIAETDGVIAEVFDNFGRLPFWKFQREGYTAAIYFIDQPMETPIQDTFAVCSWFNRACMVKYAGFDQLASSTQAALSVTFGLEPCNEEWCCLNDAYMPYRVYFGPFVISETWTTKWEPECKQELIENYNGITRTRVMTGETWNFYYSLVWTERYYQWDLTECKMKSITYLSVARDRWGNIIHVVGASVDFSRGVSFFINR